MNQDETSAKEFLKSEGYKDIEYEPDGNVPPDFLLDERIAVEVRRLNQNIQVDGKTQGLESADISLEKDVREVLNHLGSAPTGGQPYYVKYGFQRPLPKRKHIKRELRIFLEGVRSGTISPVEQTLACGLRVAAIPSSHQAANQFRPALIVDEDSGGEVFDLLKQNVEQCIAEKTQKIAQYKCKYPEWWLVLVDYIGHRFDGLDLDQLQNSVTVTHSWNRIVLIDPDDPTCTFEV